MINHPYLFAFHFQNRQILNISSSTVEVNNSFFISLIVLLSILLFLFVGFFFILGFKYFKNNYVFRKKYFKNHTFYIQQIAQALMFFSRKKIGALIVFQKNISLNKHLTNKGVLLNAELSFELLESLFAYKKNQLHDGALIINNWKIQRAHAVLPLIKTSKVAKSGIRHLAAAGICQKTDAVVCLVSETTRQIVIFWKEKNKLKNRKVRTSENISQILKERLLNDKN